MSAQVRLAILSYRNRKANQHFAVQPSVPSGSCASCLKRTSTSASCSNFNCIAYLVRRSHAELSHGRLGQDGSARDGSRGHAETRASPCFSPCNHFDQATALERRVRCSYPHRTSTYHEHRQVSYRYDVCALTQVCSQRSPTQDDSQCVRRTEYSCSSDW